MAEAEAATIAKIESFIFLFLFYLKLVGFDGLSGLKSSFYTVKISELMALFSQNSRDDFSTEDDAGSGGESSTCDNDCITYAPFKCNIRVHFPK